MNQNIYTQVCSYGCIVSLCCAHIHVHHDYLTHTGAMKWLALEQQYDYPSTSEVTLVKTIDLD